MADISFEEKVDYIYKELRGQKRTRFLNFAFKLSIVIILIFGALNISKGLENDAVISKVSSIVGTIIKPIINDLIKDGIEEGEVIENTNQKTLETPEIINNLEDKG